MEEAQRRMTQATITHNDLPIWMQKTMRGTDWGVLIVLAFSLLAAWSLLLQPGLPRTNASEHYVYRAADYARSFSEGRLFPRWSPDALNGYGAPIPHFYPPGEAYLPALITVFITGDATRAVKLVFAGALILAGEAVYAFVTRRSGAAAGVIAALLYVYSPYVGLTVPHLLGDLPGMISLALIPALLWSVDRLLRVNRPLDLVYVTMFTAALILTAPSAALVGWVLAAALVIYTRPSISSIYQTLCAGALGLMASAFYWLPALVEANAVQWYERPLAFPQALSFTELITPVMRLDPNALTQAPQFTLGLALVGFSLASLPLVIRRNGFHRLFLLLGAGLGVLALTVLREEVWLLGIITLCLSIGASVIVNWSKSRLLLPILCGLILGTAAPISIAPRWTESPIDTSPQAQIEYEQQGFGIAVLPPGEALPSLVPPTTPANRALIAGYENGQVIKVEQNPGAQIGILEHGTHQDRLQVQTFAPVTLNVLTADFPGWTAHFDGATLPISHAENGLILVNLADGARGELTITLGSTTARAFAWIITWAALLLLVLVTVQRSRTVGEEHYQPPELLNVGQARLLAVLLIGFTAMLALVALPSAPLADRVPPDDGLTGSVALDNHTSEGIELTAYHAEKTAFEPGEPIDLTLYWQTTQQLSENYRVRVSLLDLTTGAFRQRTTFREPGGYPTMRWLPNLYVPDSYSIRLGETIPVGRYSPTLEVCPADCTAGSRLSFTREDGGAYGQVLVLPIILTVGDVQNTDDS